MIAIVHWALRFGLTEVLRQWLKLHAGIWNLSGMEVHGRIAMFTHKKCKEQCYQFNWIRTL